MEFALRAAVGSGMRRGEIVGLDVRDIDFEAGEIHVVHGTDSLGRQKDTKTAASKRALPMPASLKADLRERIAAIEEMFAETRKETGSPWPVSETTRRSCATSWARGCGPIPSPGGGSVTGTATAARA